MELKLITALRPGTSLSISSDNSTIRANFGNEEEFFDAFEPEKKLSIKHARNLAFNEIVSISDEATRLEILGTYKFEINDDELSEKQLRLIRGGVSCRMDFPEDLAPDVPDGEATNILFHVLRVDSQYAYLLGIITVVPNQLGKDENLVTVLDVLGFTAKMRQYTKNHSVRDFENEYSKVLTGALGMATLISMESVMKDESGGLDLSPELTNLESVIMSDTVILFPRVHGMSLSKLCGSISMVIECSLHAGWLFRGAVDVGPFYAAREKSVFIGEAFLTAHELELSQNWAGCILSSNVVHRFRDEVDELLASGLLVRYPVPYKTDIRSTFHSDIAINWTYYTTGMGDRRRALRKLQSKAPPAALEKYKNTLEFLKYVPKAGLESKAPIKMIGYFINSHLESPEF